MCLNPFVKHSCKDNTDLDAAEKLKKVVEKSVHRSVLALNGYHKMGHCLFGVLFALLVAGCGSGPDGSGGSAGEGRSLFGGSGSGGAQDVAAWSIGLATFSGPDRAASAAAAAERFRSADRVLSDAFVVSRGNRAVVLLGEYASPSSREAVALLERVRAVRIDGEQLFKTAFFVPPRSAAASDLDLRMARAAFDADATLQVGAYGRIDRKFPTENEIAEFRALAEEAAAELRAQGEQAFYFHGPSMSMVTVGAMRFEDLEANPGILRVLRERFPHNLLNGAGIREKIRTEAGEDWRLQPSQLVAIPE